MQKEMEYFKVHSFSEEECDLLLAYDEFTAAYERTPMNGEILQLLGENRNGTRRIMYSIIGKELNSVVISGEMITSEMFEFIVSKWDFSHKDSRELMDFIERSNNKIRIKRISPYIRQYLAEQFHLPDFDNQNYRNEINNFAAIEGFYAMYGRMPDKDKECQLLIGTDLLPAKIEIWCMLFECSFDYSVNRLRSFFRQLTELARWRPTEREYEELLPLIRAKQTNYIINNVIDFREFDRDNERESDDEDDAIIIEKSNLSPWWIDGDFSEILRQHKHDELDECYAKKWEKMDNAEFEGKIHSLKISDKKRTRKLYFNELVAWYLIKREQYKLDNNRYPSDQEIMDFWGIDAKQFQAIKELHETFR
jgi:hypothetical protein